MDTASVGHNEWRSWSCGYLQNEMGSEWYFHICHQAINWSNENYCTHRNILQWNFTQNTRILLPGNVVHNVSNFDQVSMCQCFTYLQPAWQCPAARYVMGALWQLHNNRLQSETTTRWSKCIQLGMMITCNWGKLLFETILFFSISPCLNWIRLLLSARMIDWPLPTALKPDVKTVTWEIDGSGQDCSNSCELAMELPQSCTKPSKWSASFGALTSY